MVALPRVCPKCGNRMYHYSFCEKCPLPEAPGSVRADADVRARQIRDNAAALERLAFRLSDGALTDLEEAHQILRATARQHRTRPTDVPARHGPESRQPEPLPPNDDAKVQE